MLQIRIHGRGGQGVVTAAELLSAAAFLDGKFSLAFPGFGSERTGAPVAAFCRIIEREIRAREPVVNPDVIIVQDPTLLHQVDVFAGYCQLKPDLADWTCGGHSVIPDKSMNTLEANCVLRVEFSLS